MLLIVRQKGISLKSSTIKLWVADVQHRQGLMQGFAITGICALWEDVNLSLLRTKRQVGLE